MITDKSKRLRIRQKSKSNKQHRELYYNKVLCNSVTFRDKNFTKYVIFNDVFVYVVFRFILNISSIDGFEYEKLQNLLYNEGITLKKINKEKEITTKNITENYIMKMLKKLNNRDY